MKSLTPIELPADPTEDLQAATKQYVDANAGGTSGAVMPLTAVVDGALVFVIDEDTMSLIPVEL